MLNVIRQMKTNTEPHKCDLFGKAERERTLADFKLTERVYPPNFLTPDHFHENALFTFVLGGSYTEVFGAKRRQCERASALFHPGGDIHAEHFENDGARLFIVEMKCKLERANTSANSISRRNGAVRKRSFAKTRRAGLRRVRKV